MTTHVAARPRLDARPRESVLALARIEASRMLRHPAPWVGLALSAWFASGVEDAWASARYQGLQAAATPLLLGVSVAAASAFGREHVAVADDASLSAARRALARFVGGLSLVAVVAVVVLGVAVLIEMSGGLPLGDEPGRTLNARYTVPELVQPVVLAALAVALGSAAARVVRSTLVASIVLFVFWFVSGATYWVFNGDVLRWVAPLQVQPVQVHVGPARTDPTTFPADWLLSVPGEYQDGWVRLVVSPSLAAWHDVYLIALTMLAIAVALPGRPRRLLAVGGVVLAVVAVTLQITVSP